jgi:hypothetical protein
MKTIGFATFIRVCIPCCVSHQALKKSVVCSGLMSLQFERTVKPETDPDNRGYIVSAKVPAISAEGEATSQFQHLLKYPLEDKKLMLYNLDQLVAGSSRKRESFYVVEIKEAANTT